MHAKDETFGLETSIQQFYDTIHPPRADVQLKKYGCKAELPKTIDMSTWHISNKSRKVYDKFAHRESIITTLFSRLSLAICAIPIRRTE